MQQHGNDNGGFHGTSCIETVALVAISAALPYLTHMDMSHDCSEHGTRVTADAEQSIALAQTGVMLDSAYLDQGDAHGQR
jgi:hypothetical protein